MICVVSCGSTSFPWLAFFFGALLCRSMIHKHTGRWTWLYQPLDPSTLESIDPWIHRHFNLWTLRSRRHLNLSTLGSIDTLIYGLLDPSTLESIDPWIHRQFNLWTLGSIDTWTYRAMGSPSWFVFGVVDLLTLGSIDPWIYWTLDLSSWHQTGKSRALIKPDVSIMESQHEGQPA